MVTVIYKPSEQAMTVDLQAGRAGGDGDLQAGRAGSDGDLQAGRAGVDGDLKAGRTGGDGDIQAGRAPWRHLRPPHQEAGHHRHVR